MNRKTLDFIAQQLRGIAGRVVDFKGQNASTFQIHDGVGYGLLNEDARAFNDVVKIFVSHADYAERFSEKFLSDRLKSIFSTILKSQGNLENQITSLIAELNGFSRKTTVYLQVIGVAVDGTTEIGNISLIKCDKAVADDLKAKANQIISTIKNPDDQKAIVSEFLCAALDDELLGQTVAVCTVDAEPIRAFERAIEETSSVIDVLHFMAKGIIGIPTKVKIGLKGQVVSTIRRGFLLSHNQLNTRADRVGPDEVLHLNASTIARMETLGYSRLTGILRKKTFSQFERALLRAVHWFSQSSISGNVENAFLMSIISLESIFTPEQGSPIGSQIAEGCAFVLETTVEERQAIRDRVIRYYRLRSSISHGGSKSITTGDYYDLLTIAGRVIVELTKRLSEIASHKDLMKWIDKQRFL